jgi:hypothetical protein
MNADMSAWVDDGHLSLDRVAVSVVYVACKLLTAAVYCACVALWGNATIAAFAAAYDVWNACTAARKSAAAVFTDNAIVTLFEDDEFGLTPDAFFAITVNV